MGGRLDSWDPHDSLGLSACRATNLMNEHMGKKDSFFEYLAFVGILFKSSLLSVCSSCCQVFCLCVVSAVYGCALLCNSLQVTDSTFTDAAEQEEWFVNKTKQYVDPHPERAHPTNWRLTERFYIHNQGRTTKKGSELEQTLSRVGSDVQAATSMMLGEEHNPNKTKTKDLTSQGSLEQGKHFGWQTLQEHWLAGDYFDILEKSLPTSALSQVRDGLTVCRQAKEDGLDILEECKAFSPDPQKQQEMLATLSETHSKLQEHVTAILEIMQKHKPPVNKQDPTPASERPELRDKKVPLRQVLKCC